MLQQWIDLACFTGIQTRKGESPYTLDMQNPAALECNTEETNVDEMENQ